MIPAQQGFHPYDAPAAQVGLGLIVQLQPSVGERTAQTVFQRHIFQGERSNVGGVELIVMPAAILGAIHCFVGGLGQVFRGIGVLRKYCTSNVCRGHYVLAIDKDRPLSR